MLSLLTFALLRNKIGPFHLNEHFCLHWLPFLPPKGEKAVSMNPKVKQIVPADGLAGSLQVDRMAQVQLEIFRSGCCGNERSVASREWPRAIESCSVVASVQWCQGQQWRPRQIVLIQDLGHRSNSSVPAEAWFSTLPIDSVEVCIPAKTFFLCVGVSQ